ncbi:MAG TPA: hypothetical protein VE177_00180, partial [Candidatus Binatus sp.]|nr:hypothetical protein [Candidatus Binatus sp.]
MTPAVAGYLVDKATERDRMSHSYTSLEERRDSINSGSIPILALETNAEECCREANDQART